MKDGCGWYLRLVVVVWVCLIVIVSGDLEAYFAFNEGSGASTQVLRGGCGNNARNNLVLRTTDSWFDPSSKINGTALRVTGDSQVLRYPQFQLGQVSAGLSYGAWVFYRSDQNNVILYKSQPGTSLDGGSSRVPDRHQYTLYTRENTIYCSMLLGRNVGLAYARILPTNLRENSDRRWIYIGCTHTGSQLCIYARARDSQSNAGWFCQPVNDPPAVDNASIDLNLGGACSATNTNCKRYQDVYFDEVSIWSNSLTQSSFAALSDCCSRKWLAPEVPVSIKTSSVQSANSLNVSFFEKVDLNIGPMRNSNSATLNIALTQATCGILSVSPTSPVATRALNISLEFGNTGNLSLGICSSVASTDPLYSTFPFSTSTSVGLQINPAAPQVLSSAITNHSVLDGNSLIMTMPFSGFPKPILQWYRFQQLLDVPSDDFNTTDSSINGTQSNTTIALRTPTATFHFEGEDLVETRMDSEITGITIRYPKDYLPKHYLEINHKRQLSNDTTTPSISPSPSVNNTNNTNFGWVLIPGETSETLIIRSVNSSFDGSLFRLVATNPVDSVSSPNISVRVTSRPIDPNNPNNPGGSASTGGTSGRTLATGALIGIIVGAFAGCCLLLCLLFLIFIVILVAVRKSTSDRFAHGGRMPKPIKPNFDEFLYSGADENSELVKNKNTAAYASLERLLTGEEAHNGNKPEQILELSKTIMEHTGTEEATDVAKKLAYILESRNRKKGVILVQALIASELAEINIQQQSSTLFRTNSSSQKVFASWSKLVGLDYLWNVLSVPINEIEWRAKDANSEPNTSTEMETTGSSSSSDKTTLLNLSMEIDPTKIEDSSLIEENTLELWLTAQKLLRIILKSEAAVPTGIIQVLYFLSEELRNINDDMVLHIACGNFFWLRFVCPPIMVPQSIGLLPAAPCQTAQRQLILVSKVLQNLANNSMPGQKEQYMMRLNEFINNNRESLKKFYAGLLQKGRNGGGTEVDVDVPDDVLKGSLVYIHKWLYRHSSEIEKDLSDEVRTRLREVLNELGKPA
eukprot:TRINITY_DN141_c0_g2_i1.p1 TRINITY_DN141_c0_g2~~TRINITY_DN141_c0_g2_i1.p1  ORF type:complete len:1031 (-),score=199.65 TRINITY_DN141_c0_g2_i1:77-3169(-)